MRGVSLVIPIFNEQASLWPLYKRIIEVLSRMDFQYEIIFIDDGSRDKTFEVLQSIQKQDKNIKIAYFND